MKNLLSTFKVVVAFFFVTAIAEAQTSRSINDYFAVNNPGTKPMDEINSDRSEIENLKEELHRLQNQLTDWKESIIGENENKNIILTCILLHNNLQQQKTTLEVFLPDYTIDGNLVITDKSGRLLYNKIVRNGLAYNIDYATWPEGEYIIELFTEGTLVEATAMNRSK